MSDIADRAANRRRHWARSGGSHDRLVRLMRIVLPAGVGALAAVMLFAPFSQRTEISFLLSKDSVEVAKERLRVSRALYRGTDAKGQPFALAADSAVQANSREPVVRLNGLSAAIRLADGPAQITAPTSRYNMTSEQIYVDGPLSLTSAGGYAIDTGFVTVDLKDRSLSSDRRVTGRMPLGRFAGNRLFVDLDQRIVRLDGAARLTIFQGAL